MGLTIFSDLLSGNARSDSPIIKTTFQLGCCGSGKRGQAEDLQVNNDYVI